MSSLAEQFGVSTTDIIAANTFADPNNLPVGDQIIVPSPSLWPWNGPASAAGAGGDSSGETAVADVTEAPTDTPEADTPTPEPEPTDIPTAEVETATATEAPAEAPKAAAAPSSNSNPSLGSTRDQFAAGYIAGGGPPQYLEYLMSNVIPCESGFNLRAFNPAGPFYGLLQFLPETWARTGGGDWFDAWQQGHNTGVLLQTAGPSSQWPACWFASS